MWRGRNTDLICLGTPLDMAEPQLGREFGAGEAPSDEDVSVGKRCTGVWKLRPGPATFGQCANDCGFALEGAGESRTGFEGKVLHCDYGVGRIIPLQRNAGYLQRSVPLHGRASCFI